MIYISSKGFRKILPSQNEQTIANPNPTAIPPSES